MISSTALLPTAAYANLSAAAPHAWNLLAQAASGDADDGKYTLPVAVIMLCLILGVMVTLRPTKRADEIKKPED